MLKFSRDEALQIVKTAAGVNKQARLADAANRLLKLLPEEKRAEVLREAGIEKQGELLTLATLGTLAKILIPAAITGGLGYLGYQSTQDANEEMKAQAATEIDEMKKMRQGAVEGMQKRFKQFDTIADAKRRAASTQKAPQSSASVQPKSIQDRIIEYIRSLKEGDLQSMLQRAQPQQQRYTPQQQWRRTSPLGGFVGGMDPRYTEAPEGFKMPGIEPPPEYDEEGFAADDSFAAGPPDELYEEMQDDGLKMSSTPAMRKEAAWDKAVMALLPAIWAGTKRGGRFLLEKALKEGTRRTMKQGLQRGGQYLARPAGYALGGTKSIFGKLLQRMPGETLKETGKHMASRGSRIMSDPRHAGYFGSKLLGGTARGIGSLGLHGASYAGTYGLGEELGSYVRGKPLVQSHELNPFFAGLSAEQIPEAADLLNWMQNVQKPTEGEADESDQSADQAGL